MNINKQIIPMNLTIFLKIISFRRIFDTLPISTQKFISFMFFWNEKILSEKTYRIKSNFFIIFAMNHSLCDDFWASGMEGTWWTTVVEG